VFEFLMALAKKNFQSARYAHQFISRTSRNFPRIHGLIPIFTSVSLKGNYLKIELNVDAIGFPAGLCGGKI